MIKNFDYLGYLKNNILLKEGMDNTGGVSFDDNVEDKPSNNEKQLPNMQGIVDDIFEIWDEYYDDREGIEMSNISYRNNWGLEFIFDENGLTREVVGKIQNILENNNTDYKGEDETLVIYPSKDYGEELNEEEDYDDLEPYATTGTGYEIDEDTEPEIIARILQAMGKLEGVKNIQL